MTDAVVWELERPEDNARWWVRDTLYTQVARTPLSDSVFTEVWDEGVLCVCHLMSTPGGRGFTVRVVNGYSFISPLPIEDPEEINRRAEEFHKRVAAFAKNVDVNIARIAEAQRQQHVEWEKADLESDNLLELVEYWRRVLRTLDLFWKLHFEIVFPRHTIAGLLEAAVLAATDLETGGQVGRLVQSMGMTRQIELDMGLWRLAARTIELGLSDEVLGTLETELAEKLRESEKGRQWLGELDEFLDRFGHRTTLIMELSDPTWQEDPSTVLGTIRTNVAEGGEYDFERVTEKMAADRQRLTAEVLDQIADPEQRASIEGQLEPARKLQHAMEDDGFEMAWVHALVRRIAIATGRRLAEAGVLGDPEDVVFLRKDEIDKALIELATGVYDMGSWTELVEGRKAERARNVRLSPPAYIGDFPEHVHDFLLNNFWGITGRAQLDAAQSGPIEGTAASAGVAEGVARLVLGPSEFGQVEAGEILVCRSTNPVWTPLFSKIAGVVTDQGGTLSHAAVVAREYGIPAVLGTQQATTRIADGARIRVDGDKGTVEVL